MQQLHTETSYSHQAGLALLADQNHQWIRSFSKELNAVITILENKSLPIEFRLRSFLNIIPLGEYLSIFAQFPVLFEVFIHADPNSLKMISRLFRTVAILLVSGQINNSDKLGKSEASTLIEKLATLYHQLYEILETANESMMVYLKRQNGNGHQ